MFCFVCRQTVWLHLESTSLLELLAPHQNPSMWLITPTKHQTTTLLWPSYSLKLYLLCYSPHSSIDHGPALSTVL